MGNVSGKAYALTIMSPIKAGHCGEVAYADEVRDRLQNWNALQNSPMAKVPETYFCRFYVLDDVYSESLAGPDFWGTLDDVLSIFSDKIRRSSLPKEDHLKSKYLVFCCNLHGDPDSYLRGMWAAIGDQVKHVWEFCYAFEQVSDADSFVRYMKKCQLTAALFFVGSTDDALQEQLKSLYLKQEFGKFAVEHQGLPAAELQQAYQAFIKRVDPTNLAGPAWEPGQYSLLHYQEAQP